jgi:hypothetical protein
MNKHMSDIKDRDRVVLIDDSHDEYSSERFLKKDNISFGEIYIVSRSTKLYLALEGKKFFHSKRRFVTADSLPKSDSIPSRRLNLRG